jgi:hypothetical protein
VKHTYRAARLASSDATRHRITATLAAVGLVVLAARIVAVFALNVHTDEFVLLRRAVETARTGALLGGGRPGLATLVLVPFAAACRNAVDAIVQARMLWTGIVVVAAAAFWYLLRGVLPPAPHRRAAATTGLALWVLAAPFLEASAQVRSDQPAILFGLLGGLALLASRRRTGWAPLAGLLFGAGFLFSQKLVYVAGLAAVLAAGQVLLQGDWPPRRDALRLGLTAAGFLLLIAVYRAAMVRLATAPPLLPVGGGMSQFAHYREVVGWQVYRGMLPLLVPQLLVLAGLVGLTVAWVRDRQASSRELAIAWAVFAVGLGVMLFHAGRFAYFYMVLGLFPAAVAALITGPALDRARSRGARAAMLGAVWIPLAALALFQGVAMTVDRQRHQRASLEWVERTFPPDASGFNDWAAFACREYSFRARFFPRLREDFGGARRAGSIREIVDEFRDRPVAFMIPPVSPWYPAELREFWGSRYVHYRGAVHVPGRHVRGGPGWAGAFDVLVPGDYRWLPEAEAAGPLEVVGRRVEAGHTVLLDEPRVYALRLPEGGAGLLVLALPDPPAPDPTPFFDRP